jgi:S-sulfo-L-cysteine synthase (O-acetyl-L-serine-dependent)
MTILDNIGNTPIVEIKNLWDSKKTGVRILAKLEGMNPGGSVKDRTAFYMIRDAEKSGLLTEDKIILEPTSGNTGIGLAMIASVLGYKIKLIMPSCVSQERRAILAAYGAELELSPGQEKTDGAIRRAYQIIEENFDKYYMPNQFENHSNWRAHYETTAPEIIRDTEGKIDCLVAGMGTTGTLMGCKKYFIDKKINISVAGVEPGIDHKIQGLKNMNESIVPGIYDKNLLDRKINCNDEDAFNLARELAVKEGLFCGLSSGAALWGAIKIAEESPRGTTIVVIFPDRGDRYLSSEVFTAECVCCPP